MNQPIHPEDRPDPMENMPAMRARVPDDIGRGAFSSGVIVMTGPSEFILDFVQNLGRPHQIVARVVMPQPVMPQFIEALATNIDLYRHRFGELPQPNLPQVPIQMSTGGPDAPIGDAIGSAAPSAPKSHAAVDAGSPSSHSTSGSHATSAGPAGGPVDPGASTTNHAAASPSSGQPNLPPAGRRPTAQEVYGELKMRDELLSGSYANAVMIGHGPHEFSFDFITNFFPQSAVSSRVFLAAGQIPRLLESLRSAWDQIRPR